MWKVIQKDGADHLDIMTAVSGKRKQLKLTGPFCYANKKKRGDVQLILDRDKKRLEVHHAIKAAVHDLHKSKKRRKSAWTKGWQRFCRAAAVMSTASISASS
jgi:putative transposase